jgi:hypothetical protein
MPESMTSTVPSRSIRTHEWVYLVMRADRERGELVVMGRLDSGRRGHASVWAVTARIRVIRRYIIWRNNHAYDERLRRIVDRANVA